MVQLSVPIDLWTGLVKNLGMLLTRNAEFIFEADRFEVFLVMLRLGEAIACCVVCSSDDLTEWLYLLWILHCEGTWIRYSVVSFLDTRICYSTVAALLATWSIRPFTGHSVRIPV